MLSIGPMADFYNWHKKDIDSFKGLKYTIAPRREMSEDIHLLKRR